MGTAIQALLAIFVRSEHMDGLVLGLFLSATFLGAVVSGVAGFVGSLAVDMLGRLRRVREAVRVRSGWMG